MQTRHKTRTGLLAGLALTALLLTLQGCATRPLPDRGFAPKEADALIVKHIGTDRPASTTLGSYYQAEEKIVSWTTTWNCNQQLVVVTVRNLVLDAGTGNYVEGTLSTTGDDRCASWSRTNMAGYLDSERVAGRYTSAHLYLYALDSPMTFINKYRIDKGALTFLGQVKYIDKGSRFDPAKANPTYGLTRHKIAESGGPSDMWESTEFRLQTTDPRQTAEARRQATMTAEGRQAGQLANEIASRRAENDADERAANRAANAAAFQAIAQNFAAESARRRAEAAQPRSSLLADSQRAADDARAATERRAAAARQGTTQPSRLTAPAPTPPSAPARASATTPSASVPMPILRSPPGGRASLEPSRTYSCPSSKYFTSSIHYRGPNKEETFTFEEACGRAGREAAAFAANVGTPVSYTYGKHVVKRVDTCRKTKSGEQAVVYVHLEGPSSEPCGAPGTAVSR